MVRTALFLILAAGPLAAGTIGPATPKSAIPAELPPETRTLLEKLWRTSWRHSLSEAHDAATALLAEPTKVWPAIPFLVQLLGDAGEYHDMPDPRFRRVEPVGETAARILAGLGDPGRAALANTLRTGTERARECAAHGFVRLSEEGIEPLAALLADREDPHRLIAARALGRIPLLAVVPPLVVALKEDPDPKVRAAAARSLGVVGAKEASEALLAAATDEKALIGLRVEAVRSLGWIGVPEAVESLLEVIAAGPPGLRPEAIDALGGTGDPRVVERLLALREARDPSPGAPIVRALARLRDPRGAEVLLRALESGGSYQEVRRVMEALAAMGEVRAVGPLVALGVDPCRVVFGIREEVGGYARVRREVLEALDRIGPKAIEPLESLAESGSEDEQVFAREALERIRGGKRE